MWPFWTYKRPLITRSSLAPIFVLFLINVVLDTVSAHIQVESAWLIVYTDDIVFIDEKRLMLERPGRVKQKTVVLN